MIIKGGKKSIDCRVAKTPLSKAIGLMMRRKITPLLFVFSSPTRFVFHTFFMLKTIDIIFISADKSISQVITAKPWRIIKAEKDFQFVLECEKCQFKAGEKLSFVNA